MDIALLVPEWIRALTPYVPGMPVEMLERKLGITGSMKLASNENPLGPSPRALEAMVAALNHVHRYPDGDAVYLKQRLAEKLKVDCQQIIIGNGSNEIIELVVRTFLRPGEEAVMADQAFAIYRMVVQAAGGKPRVVPLKNFTHDLPGMAQAITGPTRLVFLANPNNPTGTIYRRSEWENFLCAVPDGVIMVVDDAYAEYVEDPDYPDSLAYHGRGKLLLTLRTFSKIYGLAGLRIGYGVAGAEIIEALNRVRQPFNVNSLAQAAALAALDDDEHLERSRKVNREGMVYLQRECRRLHVDFVPSWANFLLIGVGNGKRTYEALLRHGIIVRSMDGYGFPHHIRVTVGTAEENRRFIGALAVVLGSGESPP